MDTELQRSELLVAKLLKDKLDNQRGRIKEMVEKKVKKDLEREREKLEVQNKIRVEATAGSMKTRSLEKEILFFKH